jgi:peptidylprolyl isomerase
VAPTPAKPGAEVVGIPPLTGNPTDLKTQSSAGAGTGKPPTTLLTQDVVVGTGAPAKASDTVSIRYSGTLYDGTPFDASWKDGDTPVNYPLAQFVPGFSLGVEGMKPGGRRVIVIPPALGYGEQGNGPVPGNATIVFVVDLVGIS